MYVYFIWSRLCCHILHLVTFINFWRMSYLNITRPTWKTLFSIYFHFLYSCVLFLAICFCVINVYLYSLSIYLFIYSSISFYCHIKIYIKKIYIFFSFFFVCQSIVVILTISHKPAPKWHIKIKEMWLITLHSSQTVSSHLRGWLQNVYADNQKEQILVVGIYHSFTIQ